MSKHTPEPWGLAETLDDYTGAIITSNTRHIAQTLTHDAIEVSEEEEANGRRIVAAVNACAGIPTEELEAGIMGDIRAALLHASMSIHHPACPARKNAGNGCICHVEKARVILSRLEGK